MGLLHRRKKLSARQMLMAALEQLELEQAEEQLPVLIPVIDLALAEADRRRDFSWEGVVVESQVTVTTRGGSVHVVGALPSTYDGLRLRYVRALVSMHAPVEVSGPLSFSIVPQGG